MSQSRKKGLILLHLCWAKNYNSVQWAIIVSLCQICSRRFFSSRFCFGCWALVCLQHVAILFCLLLPVPVPLKDKLIRLQYSILGLASGLVSFNSNIIMLVLLSILVCEALAPCCVRWPPRRKGRRRGRKPWFKTFFTVLGPLELFKRNQVLWNFSKGLRFTIRSRKSLKSRVA